MATPGPVSHVSSAPPARTWGGLSLLLAFGPLSLLAERLVGSTHHRPLGAVTFASFALVLWVILELYVRHGLSAENSLATLAARERPRAGGSRALLGVSSWALGLASTGWCIFRAIAV